MPYIKKSQRPRLERALDELLIIDEGELNYAVCKLFMRYCDTTEGKLDYKKINAGLGAITEAADEVRVRIKRGYEHQKIIENGDVFDDFIKRHNIREFS